jgi:uncharacterized protein (DUF302 family)
MLGTSYTLNATTPLAFTNAVDRVRAELKAEGFGVLLSATTSSARWLER